MSFSDGCHFVSPPWKLVVARISGAARSASWARRAADPAAFVKPFVKRQKNDTTDAEAICEAATRPTMRFIPVKSEETQGAAMEFRVRELLIRQRTQAINASC